MKSRTIQRVGADFDRLGCQLRQPALGPGGDGADRRNHTRRYRRVCSQGQSDREKRHHWVRTPQNTDTNGSFTFTNLRPDDYDVSVEATGFVTLKLPPLNFGPTRFVSDVA